MAKGAAMRTRWNRTCLVGLSLGILFLITGCGPGAGKTPEGSPIRVEVSQMFITVKNESGLALRNVKVEILPYGGATNFAVLIPRLDVGEKRDLSLGNFRGLDGTPFDRRVVRAKSVVVSGTTINNVEVKVEVGWK
jgi:hypothetical protein